MKPNSQCFNDVSRNDAEILILGSIPGIASLEAQQYYAHPRNAFWKIIQSVTDVDANAPYQNRLNGLLTHKIALWDVVASCHRSGSLDSAIKPHSITINDFASWFQQHSHTTKVLLNGGKAHELFQRHVIKNALVPHTISVQRCPSTSPAFASLSFEDKKSAWLTALK